MAPDGPAVVSIVAPAGYGKTTLLRQWADRLPTSSYVSLEARDNDPLVLLSAIASALDRNEPLDPVVVTHLSSSGHSLERTLLPELLEAMWRMRTPTVLMLDDLHVVDAPVALDAVAYLMLHQPPLMRLAIASRHITSLPFPRLRVAGRLMELGPDDLRLDLSATSALASVLGLSISPEEAAALVARTEGWPAATYLAIRAARPGTVWSPPGVGLRATEATIADYVRSELLVPLEPDLQRWLVRSSVLETMTGPLCDAALGMTGSLARLRRLEQDNQFVVALDANRSEYRYHQLLRDVLRDQLELREPDEVARISARASAWHAEHGDPDQAVRYAHASGDMDRVARLVQRYIFGMHWSGRIATVTRWLDWFDLDDRRERDLGLAIFAGYLAAMDGRADQARRWLAAAERSCDDSMMADGASGEAWISLLRGFMSPSGITMLRSDARLAMDGIPASSPFRQTALIVGAFADIVEGSLSTADELLAEAAELSEARHSVPGVVLALGERAVLALSRMDIAAARGHVERGLAWASDAYLGDHAATAIIHAAAFRVALASDSTDTAQKAINRVNGLRPRVTAAIPVLALQMRLQAIHGYLVQHNHAAARTLLLEVKDLLRRCPDFGALAHEAADVERRLEGSGTSPSGPWALTMAELRLLSYLPTHLTVSEIAARMYLSPHTVKSQLVSIYSKLGAASRRSAIELAVEAGLIDSSVLRFPEGTSGVA
jgi:LuxR family maltose regulon positive regulatory protein